MAAFPAMFILRRLSLGGRPSSKSKSSSDSPSSSKIWLSTGALFLEVRRLVMEGGLRLRITWVGRGEGSCSSSSSSSSSTLNRQVLCLAAAEVDGAALMVPEADPGAGPEAAAQAPGAGRPGESATVVSFRRPSSIMPLERCPLRRFSALRAGDWGPPAWEIEDAAKLSSMS